MNQPKIMEPSTPYTCSNSTCSSSHPVHMLPTSNYCSHRGDASETPSPTSLVVHNHSLHAGGGMHCQRGLVVLSVQHAVGQGEVPRVACIFCYGLHRISFALSAPEG